MPWDLAGYQEFLAEAIIGQPVCVSYRALSVTISYWQRTQSILDTRSAKPPRSTEEEVNAPGSAPVVRPHYRSTGRAFVYGSQARRLDVPDRVVVPDIALVGSNRKSGIRETAASHFRVIDITRSESAED